MAREEMLNANPAAYDSAAGYLGGEIASTYLPDAPLENGPPPPVGTGTPSATGLCCIFKPVGTGVWPFC